MNKTQHTPGQWHIRYPERGIGKENCEKLTIGAETGIHVATIHTGTNHLGNPSKKAQANARLIAAAPEMLESLKFCVEALEVESGELCQAHLQNARKAIAKAEGQ